MADECQTHSPSTPQTPPYSATSCGAGSDHSVFASVFIGGGSTYGGPSPTTPIHSTPPTPSPWSSMPGLPPNPSTPPPLPPRTNRGTTRHNSMSYSSDVPSPRSRYAPTFVTLTNSFEDGMPPPLPPRCSTFSATLPRNYNSHASVAAAAVAAQHHNIQRFNSEYRRNSAMELPPIVDGCQQPLLSRRYSQTTHGPLSPPPPPPNAGPVFSVPIGPCPQLPPKTYRQTLNNIAR
jgi:hypothetical protein